MDLIDKYLGKSEDKSLKEENLDEFAFFMANMMKGKSKTPSFSTKQKDAFPTGKMYDYFLEVLYHDEKNRMKALDMVVKQNKLDRKTAKELKKYVKKHLMK